MKQKQRAQRGMGSFPTFKDGFWEAWVTMGKSRRPGVPKRVHILRRDRQEAVFLFLKARAASQISPTRQLDRQPETAAEWFWIWIQNGSYRRARGIFPRHTVWIVDYVLPFLDERPLKDLTALDLASLLNRIPVLDGKRDAKRVLTDILEEARRHGWVHENVAIDVAFEWTLPEGVDDDDDATWARLDDPGKAVVRIAEFRRVG